MNIDFRSCIINDQISSDCALKLNKNNYIVKDGLNLKTKGNLHTNINYRPINVEYIIPMNTHFKYENGNVISDCVIPLNMGYGDKQWYDKFIGNPTSAYHWNDLPWDNDKLYLNECHCHGEFVSHI